MNLDHWQKQSEDLEAFKRLVEAEKALSFCYYVLTTDSSNNIIVSGKGSNIEEALEDAGHPERKIRENSSGEQFPEPYTILFREGSSPEERRLFSTDNPGVPF